jgi:hypothetical protein
MSKEGDFHAGARPRSHSREGMHMTKGALLAWVVMVIALVIPWWVGVKHIIQNLFGI